MLVLVRREDDNPTTLEEMQTRFNGKFHAWIQKNEPRVSVKYEGGLINEAATEAAIIKQSEAEEGLDAVGSFSTGDPGGTREQRRKFALAFRKAAVKAKVYMRHVYQHWDPIAKKGYKITDPESWEWHAGRPTEERDDYQSAGLRFPYLGYGELGQDRMGQREINGKIVEVGWKAAGSEQFIADLQEFFSRMSADPSFKFACIFSCGTGGNPLWDWCDIRQSAMVEEALRQLSMQYPGMVGLNILEGGGHIRQTIEYINPGVIICLPAAVDIATWAFDTTQPPSWWLEEVEDDMATNAEVWTDYQNILGQYPALAKKALALNYGPAVSDEKAAEGYTYQYYLGGIVYAKTGDWGNVKGAKTANELPFG